MYEYYIEMFFPNFHKYKETPEFKDYLHLRGRYNVNLEEYYDNEEHVDPKEVPLLEDVLRLLNCIKMQPFEFAKAKKTKLENDILRTEISDLKNINIKSLENQNKQLKNLIDRYSEELKRNIESISQMTDTIVQQKEEIEKLEQQIYYINHKPLKNQHVQCRIIHSKSFFLHFDIEDGNDVITEEQHEVEVNTNTVVAPTKSKALQKFKSVVRVISTLSGSLKMGVKPDKQKEQQEKIYEKVIKQDDSDVDNNQNKKRMKNVKLKSIKK